MKISIIMAVYNAESTIEQALESVIKQSHKDTELIIIDGGSNDGTISVIEQYQDKIAYWSSEPDRGVYDAMNKGIQRASGDIIAFLNSDDWYEESALETVNHCFSDHSVDVVAGKVNYFIKDKLFASGMPLYEGKDIHLEMIYNHQSMFVKKELFDAVGNFNTKYKITADYEWTLKAHNMGYKFMRIDHILTNFRLGGISSVQKYRGVYECKYIALSNMGDCNKESMSEKIHNSYAGISDTYIWTLYNLVLEKDIDFVRSLFPIGNRYFIWGTGNVGEQCLQLFMWADIEIQGFIDTNKKNDYFHDYKVYFPDEIKGKERICVATCLYEDEISRQLFDLGYKKQEFVLFSEIRQRMIDHGRQCYCGEVML